MRAAAALLVLLATLPAAACRRAAPAGRPVLTVSGSAVGTEAELLKRQLARYQRLHPELEVRLRPTPDAADTRHQLYVQWLNAHAREPDVLQLDVVWTPEFAAAGWILPLDRFRPATADFFPQAVAADRWAGRVYALPWFVDVGMLYWRTDLMATPPRTFAELDADAAAAQRRGGPLGFVWQGARYEGLVTVFLEYLGGYGGRILDRAGRVVVDSPEAIRALTEMRDEIWREGVVPPEALTWHEEESRLAFQEGRAALMRNWPYAYALLDDTAKSKVAGRFAVAPMPAAPGGRATAALGGAQLAVNRWSRHPAAAYALIAYLTAPAQMLERAAAVGELPTRPALFEDSALAAVLPLPPHAARAIIEHAVPRPVTPVYTQLSELLQVRLHRALTRQAEPAAALHDAAAAMRELLRTTGLCGGEWGSGGVGDPGPASSRPGSGRASRASGRRECMREPSGPRHAGRRSFARAGIVAAYGDRTGRGRWPHLPLPHSPTPGRGSHECAAPAGGGGSAAGSGGVGEWGTPGRLPLARAAAGPRERRGAASACGSPPGRVTLAGVRSRAPASSPRMGTGRAVAAGRIAHSPTHPLRGGGPMSAPAAGRRWPCGRAP